MATHAEAMLLSAVLRTGDYQTLAAQGITADLFHVYDDEWKWVEKYISKNGRTPEKAAFRAKYPEFTIYRVDDVSHWCEEVRQEHIRYTMTILMDDALNLIDQDDLEAAMRTLQTGLIDAQVKAKGSSPTYDVFSSWEETFENVEARVERVRQIGFAGVPTGFRTFDHITGGMQPSWLAIIAARLGVGKTWATVKMATHAATMGFKVSYFSLEQSRHQIAMRTHSFASKQFFREVFDSTDLSRGHGFDLRAYKEFLRELQGKVQGRFSIHDASRGAVSVGQVAAAIQTDQPDIVFIDYLTKMRGDRKGDDWQVVGQISSDLQNAAQQFNVPIVCGAQLNRMGIGKEPAEADSIAQSDKIGQDTDLLVTMVQKTPHVMKMKLAKNRHGPAGVMWFNEFNPGKGIFDEVSGDRAEELIEQDQEVE